MRDGQASVVGCPSPISHLPSPISHLPNLPPDLPTYRDDQNCEEKCVLEIQNGLFHEEMPVPDFRDGQDHEDLPVPDFRDGLFREEMGRGKSGVGDGSRNSFRSGYVEL